MKDGDFVQCVALVVLKICILHPAASSRSFSVTVDPGDVSVKFSTLFNTYGATENVDPALMHFTFNGTRLREEDSIVETLGVNDDDFVLLATPAGPGISVNVGGSDVGPHTVMIGPTPSDAGESGDHRDSLSPRLLDAPEMMLLRLKKILLTADANWLGTLIHSWPQPFPPQDDADVLSHFAQGFMSWRDGSVPYDGNERVGNSVSENFLALKMNNISTLERLHHEWKTEWVEARQTQVTASEVVDPLRKAIQENAAKRRAREAKAISILGLLIDAWRNQVTGGWALLCSGPGLYSNLRILRECGVIRDEHQAIEAILEGRPEIVFSSSAVLDGPLRASNSASVTIVGADERFYRDDTAMSSVEPPSRRQSGKLKRLKNEETPIVNRPPVAPLYADRPPAFVMRPDTLPARVLTTRREIIQHEWNKIARDSHAAGIEFINEIDDEEVPPGIGTLFPYLERKYLFDIGISEPSPLVGCRCDGIVGCSKPKRCSCQPESKPAYTAQGLFAFNTESEIVECNSYCSCPPRCVNRVAQFPRQVPVQIFKTEKRGWGARMPVKLVRGRIVGIYTGLLVRREEADKLSGNRASYCFDLDVNKEPDGRPSGKCIQCRCICMRQLDSLHQSFLHSQFTDNFGRIRHEARGQYSLPGIGRDREHSSVHRAHFRL